MKLISGFENKRYWLLKILSSQIWNLVNRSELSNSLNLDNRKLNYYLDILVWTYIVDLIAPYYTNIKKGISKMSKIYFQNLGIINYFNSQKILNLETVDWALIENLVYNMILDIIWNKNDIYYYRTISKSEIDFIVKYRDGLIPLEVKYKNKIQRFPVAIKNFDEKHSNVIKKILITKDELSF